MCLLLFLVNYTLNVDIIFFRLALNSFNSSAVAPISCIVAFCSSLLADTSSDIAAFSSDTAETFCILSETLFVLSPIILKDSFIPPIASITFSTSFVISS